MRGGHDNGMDDASEVAHEAGDDVEETDRGLLRDLNRRDEGTGLDVRQSQQHRDMSQKQIQAKAAKRAKKGHGVTCGMGRIFCKPAAERLAQFQLAGAPAAAAATGAAAASDAAPAAVASGRA